MQGALPRPAHCLRLPAGEGGGQHPCPGPVRTGHGVERRRPRAKPGAFPLRLTEARGPASDPGSAVASQPLPPGVRPGPAGVGGACEDHIVLAARDQVSWEDAKSARVKAVDPPLSSSYTPDKVPRLCAKRLRGLRVPGGPAWGSGRGAGDLTACPRWWAWGPGNPAVP